MSYDVVIAGGGLVGATLAARLARDPSISVAVLEKFPPPQSDALEQQDFHPSYDARNTALANGTCHIFDQLGLWQAMREHAVPINTIEITNKGSFGKALIQAQEERVRALGYVIENRYIGRYLFQHLSGLPNVDYLAPAQLKAIEYEANQVSLELEHQGQAQTQVTPLLVIADGAQSDGRALLGIDASVHQYQQVAIVTAVTPDRPHNNVALERFTDSGPLAVLPQTHNRLGLTWCLSPHRAQQLMDCSDQDFMTALEQEAGSAMGELTKVGKRVQYPLALTLAKEQVRPNVVVLGNAAHGLHPVAGQGFNMAARDVAVLVQHLFRARAEGVSWGDFSMLNGYFAERQQDQFNTTQFSHNLTRLFSHSNPMLNFARNAGLALFDSLQGTKRLVARHAMGRSVATELPDVEIKEHARV